MIPRMLWPLALLVGTAQAATLPLTSGAYVLAGVPCSDPPFAAMFDYDGRQFSYPHATHCRSTIVSRDDRLYRVRETCSARGDGSPATPYTTVTSYAILSRGRVDVRRANAKEHDVYRWCSSPGANKAP